jgi:opacity protein-like surface antigen
MMKRILTGAILVLGSVTAAQAQVSSDAGAGLRPLAGYSESTAFDTQSWAAAPLRDAGNLLDASTAFSASANVSSSSAASSSLFAEPAPSALPAEPAPAPDPKFLYGGRDDYRWQLGIGASWVRFRSKVFNASAVGLNTSVSYYLNNWLGVEGNILTGFAPEIFDREHVKLFNLTGGPRIAWRQRRWEPWGHALFGLSHEQPQTANASRNTFAVQLGGGADYRLNPRLSFRLEGDWLRTQFFSESQNNFVLVGGIVLHF